MQIPDCILLLVFLSWPATANFKNAIYEVKVAKLPLDFPIPKLEIRPPCFLYKDSVEDLKLQINKTIKYFREPQRMKSNYSCKINQYKSELWCEYVFNFFQSEVTALTFHVSNFPIDFRAALPVLKVALDKLEDELFRILNPTNIELGATKTAYEDLLGQSFGGPRLPVNSKEEIRNLATQVAIILLRSVIRNTTQISEENLDKITIRTILKTSFTGETGINFMDLIKFCKSMKLCSKKECMYRTLWESLSDPGFSLSSPQMLLVARSVQENTDCPLKTLRSEILQSVHEKLFDTSVVDIPAEQIFEELKDWETWKTLRGEALYRSTHYPENVLAFIDHLPKKTDKIYAYRVLFDEIMKTNGFISHGMLILVYRVHRLFIDLHVSPEVKQISLEMLGQIPSSFESLLIGRLIRIKSEGFRTYLGLTSDSYNVTSPTPQLLACTEDMNDFYPGWYAFASERGKYFVLKNSNFGGALMSNTEHGDLKWVDDEDDAGITPESEWEIHPVALRGSLYFYFKNRVTGRVLHSGWDSRKSFPPEGKFTNCSYVSGKLGTHWSTVGQLWNIE